MRKWIQKAKLHKGRLHHQLGIPAGKVIPRKLLSNVASARIGTKVRGHRVTPLLHRRAVLARTLRRLR
jgi:hypothetical protein